MRYTLVQHIAMVFMPMHTDLTNSPSLVHEQEAFLIWRNQFAREMFLFDQSIQPLFNNKLSPWKPDQESWIKLARSALSLSSKSLAKKLNLDRSSFLKFEKAEKNGSLSLIKLYEACETMDCELIVGIRPKQQLTFTESFWQRVLPFAKESWAYKNGAHRGDKVRASLLSYAVQRKAYEQKTMQALGISRIKGLLAPPFIPPSKRC